MIRLTLKQCVRRIFVSARGVADPWMCHNGDIRHAAHSYEPSREAAMAAFATSWRRG
jgi:hypothetical protein